MKLGMNYFMKAGLESLQITHAFLNCNPLILHMVIPLGSGLDIFKANRHRADIFDDIHENNELVHITLKLIDSKLRKLFSLSL